VSITSAGCVLWLEQLQPLFASLALTTLAYQGWLVLRRPRNRRTPTMLALLGASLVTTLAVAAALVVLSLRYW
jgi:hypothetical protein